jgi:hypothetical protein
LQRGSPPLRGGPGRGTEQSESENGNEFGGEKRRTRVRTETSSEEEGRTSLRTETSSEEKRKTKTRTETSSEKERKRRETEKNGNEIGEEKD